MQISDVEILEYLVSAAMASYGDLNDKDLKDALIDANFTETQAKEFLDRYDFIHQETQLITGFSATVFWDKIDEKYVLAIRGTETDIQGAYSDVLNADLLGIGGRGFAVNQAIDLCGRILPAPACRGIACV